MLVANVADRLKDIEAALAKRGLRMEDSLSMLDGAGGVIVDISSDETVDEPEGEVLELAEEWSRLRMPHHLD